MATEYNATVVGRDEIAPGLISIRVAPDNLPFEFEPGQYVVLGLKASEPRVSEADAASIMDGEAPAGTPEGQSGVAAQAAAAARAAADSDRMIRRAYCIASDSRAAERLEFFVTLILSGELTPRLFNLKVGDRLFVGPRAEGVFTLDPASTKHVLMIATGTGLAPYMSMIRNELVLRVDGRVGLRAIWQRNGPRHFALVHGARYSWDLGYRTELTGLSRTATTSTTCRRSPGPTRTPPGAAGAATFRTSSPQAWSSVNPVLLSRRITSTSCFAATRA